MPTPFYHLSVARSLLGHPSLPESLRRFLNQHRSAFLLGNTAPDVQVISGQSREATHFYTLPLRADAQPAGERMLAQYPALADVSTLDPDQAAFLSGYLCHLQADEHWARRIFDPVFGPDQAWGTFRQRLYLHNVLRAYLDLKELPTLPVEFGLELAGSPVRHWLPFVEVIDLRRWRDFLSEQLQPGAGVRTVEVFARRQGLEAEKFYEVLNSEDRMEREIFSHMPDRQLDRYRTDLFTENISLLQRYLVKLDTASY